jgi:hypothetical protein
MSLRIPRLNTIVLATLLAVALLVLHSGGASACACGELNGPVIARGVSREGIRWQINASYAPGTEDRPYLTTEFTTGDPHDGGGYGMAVPLNFSGVSATADGEIEGYSEGGVSGVADRPVVKLKMKMSNGKVLAIEPVLAAARLRKRFFWLRGVRFFDFFFPASGKPRLLTAFDREGHILGRAKMESGHFFNLYF